MSSASQIIINNLEGLYIKENTAQSAESIDYFGI